MEKKVKKVTKAQRIEDISRFLETLAENGIDMPTLPYHSSIAEMLEFLSHEKELLARKNASGKQSSAQTAKQVENEAYKTLIVNFLAMCEEGQTCTQIQQNIPDFADFNNQKIAALCRQLSEAGKIQRDRKGNKTVFSV